jgi:hypothetical protein
MRCLGSGPTGDFGKLTIVKTEFVTWGTGLALRIPAALARKIGAIAANWRRCSKPRDRITSLGTRVG